MTEPMPAELVEANKAKLAAETTKAIAEAKAAEMLAFKNKAEALKAEAEAESQRQSNTVNDFTVRKSVELYEMERASDYYHRVYRFASQVEPSSVKKALETLSVWHRIDSKCDITFTINSPGGSIVDGFELFDFLLFLRRQGHKVTTIATGMAASMGGVLLQAGDVRAVSPNSQVLIHEAQFMAGGTTGNVKDTVERVDKLQARILEIFAEGCTRAHEAHPDKCTEPLSLEQIKDRWARKDWWLNADECLKHGFVDEVR